MTEYKTIADLPLADSADALDELEVSQAGTSRRASIATIIDAANIDNPPATVIVANWLSDINRALPHPALSGAGNLVVDGNVVATGDIVHLIGQTDPVSNGCYAYDTPTNTLARTAPMLGGTVIAAPLVCQVQSGDLYGGAAFEMIEDEVTVGATPSTWASGATGASFMAANMAVLGPRLPYSQARPGTQRSLTAEDLWTYRTWRSAASATNQSIYLNLNNFGYLSRFLRPGNLWVGRAALQQCIAEYSTIIFDRAAYLEAQVGVPISNKRFVFTGNGWNGPNRIFVSTQNVSFLDIGGSQNVRFEGQCVIEALIAITGSVRAIKAVTPFTNFRAESIWSRGFTTALLIDTAFTGLSVDELNTFNYPAEQPLVLSVNTTTSSATARIGGLLPLPAFEAVVGNVNTNFEATVDSPIVQITGPMTADRTHTLLTRSAYRDAEFTFLRTDMTSFNANFAGGLPTLTAGQKSRIRWDGVAQAWKSLGVSS
jgi:hypothetical protein